MNLNKLNKPLIIDPQLKSWIQYSADCDFPIQNLPLGIFTYKDGLKKVCSIIGNQVIDLFGMYSDGFIYCQDLEISDLRAEYLNTLLARGKSTIREIRKDLANVFSESNHSIDRTNIQNHLYPLESVQLHLPVKAGDYTDFYSSREHATNVGIMFRDPANALLPNWLHLPVGYHGRASSIVVSGTDIKRPHGQMQLKEGEAPIFGLTKQLDIELEMAFVIGKENKLGHPIPIENAEDHIQGLLIFNDWSARDIQKWEYVPLGPFLGKNFASSVSAWLVDMDALEPFRIKGPEPIVPLLDYLKIEKAANFNIELEVYLITSDGLENLICKSNTKYLYWSISQQLAHHTSNGCNMQIGDICASGTISGPTPDSFGSMLELAWKGTKPLLMKDGTTRSFLQDGDTVLIKGFAQHDQYRIGFGEVSGRIVA
ncbi:MAG: fumarylacetoacetase [Saprospiraceae bacterium]|nr:fumarylacetoacetase [Saprospiraceae bacterium]MBK8450645.1 fumarylacetoacetase [Saprospiraceae bacterium]MBK9222492.1 fumarylacetoacetase [Saprospiraceae bacterium]